MTNQLKPEFRSLNLCFSEELNIHMLKKEMLKVKNKKLKINMKKKLEKQQNKVRKIASYNSLNHIRLKIKIVMRLEHKEMNGVQKSKQAQRVNSKILVLATLMILVKFKIIMIQLRILLNQILLQVMNNKIDKLLLILQPKIKQRKNLIILQQMIKKRNLENYKQKLMQ